jgi:hypothetical protein
VDRQRIAPFLTQSSGRDLLGDASIRLRIDCNVRRFWRSVVVDEDVVGLERNLTGDELMVCEFCGQPVARSSVVRVAGVPHQSEPVEALHVCEACRARIVAEDVAFEAEIAAGLQAADDEQ